MKLLLRARRFNAALTQGEGIAFAALAQREGVSRSYFTRLVRLSYLAPDITQALLDGRQPRDLTPEKLLDHSRLPLAWHDQRIVLGFGEPGPSAAIHRTIKPGERPDFIGTGVALSPNPSAALRYWNMARQRYCRRSALS